MQSVSLAQITEAVSSTVKCRCVQARRFASYWWEKLDQVKVQQVTQFSVATILPATSGLILSQERVN